MQATIIWKSWPAWEIRRYS